ncbi:AAA family ATPase [Propionimicrobium sp. PCR01-08-3]|nr:AAA family ATPase [Propionimicrobium sp. PCR01-08-3]WIY84175.1 AAA family ATPase [Propionimicrobium sp. PCR01-08-3]
MLGEDQVDALTRIAVSGRVVDVLVGPAGAGKTTAMSGLRRAWETEHEPGSVVGLAPSEAAAQVLGEDLGIATFNTAKWWQLHQTGSAGFQRGQLVIIDESSLAGTASLDRITAVAEDAGAKVLLVGDWGQLQAVDAGGAFGMLVHDRDDAPELVDIHRFTHDWERTTSLQLRHGRTDAIDTLAENGRITDGDADVMLDAAYTAWRTDSQAGLASILVAESRDQVTALNARARADLILDGTITGATEAALHDGTSVAAGDVVITRRNDRHLRTSDGRGWVRNGDRYTVLDVHDDGTLTVQPADESGGRGSAVVLPAGYVAEQVELGYAITGHRAQGITVDTAHTLVTEQTTRENFYVAMTRGRDSNMAYVVTKHPDDAHVAPHPSDNPDATARTVLYGVLHHVGAELSAHESTTAEQEYWGNIGQLAAEYESIAQTAQHDRYATLLPRLVAARDLSDADDIASVLHHRVERATTRPAGSGRTRRPARLIAGLVPYAAGPMQEDMRQALDEREEVIEQRTTAVLDTALTDRQPWCGAPGEPTCRGEAGGSMAYRGRYRIDSDAPLGPEPSNDVQKIDATRAVAALRQAQHLTRPERRQQEPRNRTTQRRGPGL